MSRFEEMLLPYMRRLGEGDARSVHLVPDRRTLARRRRAYHRLPGAGDRRQAGDVPLQMMGGWIHRLCRQLGLWVRRMESWEQRALLRLCHHRVTPGTSLELEALWSRPGMVSSLHRFVAEGRAQGRLLGQPSGAIPPELRRVIALYEAAMADSSLADSARLFEMIAGAVEEASDFRLDMVLVEGFSRFAPGELELLRAVARRTDEMTIFLPVDPELPDVYPGSEELRESMGSLYPHVQEYRPSDYCPSGLARRLFRVSPTLEEDADRAMPRIDIWTVSDEVEQGDRVASYLKKLIHIEEIAPGECCVVARNPRERSEVAHRLTRAGIPVTLSQELPLGGTSLGRTLTKLLDAIEEPTASNIAVLARSPHLEQHRELTALGRLTAYVPDSDTPEGIRTGLRTVRDSLNLQLGRCDSRRERADLEAALDEIGLMTTGIEYLLPLLSRGSSGDPAQQLEGILEVVSTLGIGDRVAYLVTEDGGASREVIADLAAWRDFDEEMPRRVGRLLGAFHPEEQGRASMVITKVLRDYLDHRPVSCPPTPGDLGLQPAAGRGVVVSDGRFPEFEEHRVVVVLNMVSGAFPVHRTPEWLERAYLPRGRWEEPLHEDREENHFFYRLARSARQRLLLVYPAEMGEAAQVPSPYLDEMKASADPATADYAASEKLDPHKMGRLSAWRDVRRALFVSSSGEGSNHGPMKAIVQGSLRGERFSFEDLHRVLGAERGRWGTTHDRWDGMVEDTPQAQILESLFPVDGAVSPTALNTYAECPFRFFAERALELRGRYRLEWDFSALLMGSMYHRILQRYFEARLDQLPHREEPPLAEDLPFLEKLIDGECDHVRRGMEWIDDSWWQSLCRRLRETLQGFLEFEEARRETEDDDRHLYPVDLEKRFSSPMSDLFPGVSLPFDLTITGTIDRADRTEAPASTARDASIIFDYKMTSKPPTVEDMKSGMDLQMPLYVAHARSEWEERDVIGGGYLSIRGCHAEHGLYTERAASLLNLEQEKAVGSDDDLQQILDGCREYVITYWRAIREGRYPVSPATADSCRYCSLGGVCRHEERRLGRREGERGRRG